MELNLQEFIDDLPHLESTSDYWLFRADSGKYFTDFFMNGYIGIGWNDITLPEIKDSLRSRELLKQMILKKMPNLVAEKENPNELYLNGLELNDDNLGNMNSEHELNHKKITSRQLNSLTGQLLKFSFDININDIIVVPSEGSQQFMVGKVISSPYEYSENNSPIEEKEEQRNYKKSSFFKRINVKWLGRFNRSQADTALYKMIFSQHTINQINEYRTFIDRALFDAYILDDEELHLTYHVTQEENIDAKLLGQFIYRYSQLYEELGGDNELKIKINVQSKGPAESTAKNMLAGAAALALLFLIGSGSYNGNSIRYENGKLEIENTGFADTNIKKQQATEKVSEEHNKQLLEREKEAYKTAKELKIPISSLGIELPKKAEAALQKQLDTDPEYNSKKQQKNTPEPDLDSGVDKR